MVAEEIQWTAACFIGSTIINTSETKRQANNSNARLENNTKETLAIEKKMGKATNNGSECQMKNRLIEGFSNNNTSTRIVQYRWIQLLSTQNQKSTCIMKGFELLWRNDLKERKSTYFVWCSACYLLHHHSQNAAQMLKMILLIHCCRIEMYVHVYLYE